MAEPTAERTTSVTELVAERLYRARTVILSGEINQRLAASISAQLLALAADSPDPITIYLNAQIAAGGPITVTHPVPTMRTRGAR